MNPEFQRNLYLELSISRLIAMPAFLLVIFSLSYLIDDQSLAETTANTAIGLFILIVLFWGTRQASENIFEELRNNTWDIQRTSAISPWSLSWGKLFGSTLYNWYGGLLCLLVYSFAAADTEFIALTWLYALSSGILAHSLSLLVSLFALRRKQSYNSGIGYLFAVVLLFFLISLINNIDDFAMNTLFWYGDFYTQSSFLAVSLILACCWSIIGVYRFLAEELRIRTLPWVWLVFIGFLSIYIAGIITVNNNVSVQKTALNLILVWFFICSSFSYLLLFLDENSPMLLRKIGLYWQNRQWPNLLQETPCWMVSVVLTLPAMIILALIPPIEKINHVYFYPLVIFLLMLRDIGLLLYFSYAQNRRRARSLTLLVMVCLYGVLPAIFLAMHINSIAWLILPVLNDNLFLAIFAAGMQTLIITFLLVQRWKNRIAMLG